MRLRIEQAVQLWATGGGLMLLSIVIVTSINVGGFALSRFGIVFGDGSSGLPGYEDYVALTIGVAALSFFPYCQLHNGHVVVELFTSNAPEVISRVLDRMWNAVVVVTALFLKALPRREDARVIVAQGDGPETAEEVEDLVPVAVRVVHALGTVDQDVVEAE